MSRRLFPGRIADEVADGDRSRAERLKGLARELVGVVRDGLIRDGQVRIHGFGTFRLSPTRARKGINPRTGERIDIPARNRVLFRPAKALRERIEPGAAPAVPLAEPHASREAALGGVMSEAPAAGAVPASDEDGQRRSYFPDRIAAAAISDTVVRTTEEPTSAASGSREANLGGTMGDSPRAGRVPLTPAAAADESTEPAIPDPGRAAANEVHERGSREAVLGTSASSSAAARTAGALPPEDLPPEAQEPERPATVPSTRHGPGPIGSAADEAGVDLPAGASREAGLSGRAASPSAGSLPAGEEDSGSGHTGFEAETPLRGETGPGTSARDTGESWPSPRQDEGDAGRSEPQPVRRRIVIDDDVESGRVPPPEADTTGEQRSRLRLLLIVLLLALLIAVLVWWFWPRAETPEVTQPADSGAVEETAPTEAPATAAVEGDAATEATGPSATAAAEEESAIEATGPEDATPAAPAEEVAETAADETGTTAVEDPAATQPERTDTAADESVGMQTGQSQQEEGAAAMAAGEGAAAPATKEAIAEAAPATAGETTTAAETGGTPWFSGRDYSVQRGDTLWGLSDNHYVNPYYWPHIWNHNPSIGNPDRIEIDQQLWLPALQGEPRALTATDRRSIAEGYLRLYRLWTETGAANPQYALVGVRYFDPSVMPSELRNDPSAGRPDDTLAAAFEAQLQAAFPRR